MMLRSILVAVAVALTAGSACFAIKQQPKKSRLISAIGLGMHVSSSITGEINLTHYEDKSSLKKFDLEVHGMGLGAEFNFNPRHFIAGPKVYYERLFKWYLAGRTSFTWYTDFKINDPRITPEIALTVFGLVSVGYGYNIPLTKNELMAIGRHKGMVMIKIPRGL